MTAAIRVDMEIYRCKKCRRMRRASRLTTVDSNRVCSDTWTCAAIQRQTEEAKLHEGT